MNLIIKKNVLSSMSDSVLFFAHSGLVHSKNISLQASFVTYFASVSKR